MAGCCPFSTSTPALTPMGSRPEHGAQITGEFSPTTAQQLAAEIAAPPLPANLQMIDSTTFTKRGG